MKQELQIEVRLIANVSDNASMDELALISAMLPELLKLMQDLSEAIDD